MRILYLVSLFPCWSETFIVREIAEMLRLGADIRIISLKHASESMVQSDAHALLDRVIYPGPWWRSLLAMIAALAAHPIRELIDLVSIARSLRGHPRALVKTVIVWWRTLGLLSTVRELAPSHIHAHWATYPSTAALLLRRRLNIPFSFTAHAHDIFLEDHLLAEKMRSAAFTVAISQYNKDYLRKVVPGPGGDNVKIVHCGVSLGAFPFMPQDRDPRRILAVGRLDEIKGFPYLIEACGVLHAKGVQFQCDIVGSGPLQAELSAKIDALGLGSQVRLLGARKQEEVRDFMRNAGVFALPSVITAQGDRDGIPVALMEAMSSGMPVVSTRVSGIPELVEDGVTGLLAPPRDVEALADCLERLIGDRPLGIRLAQAARARIEQEFDVQKESRKLFDAIAACD